MILLLVLAVLVLAVGVLFFAEVLFVSWMVMLAVGVAHLEWLPMMPTIGFWPTVLIVLLLQCASAPALLAAGARS